MWWWARDGGRVERESLAHDGLSLFFNSSYFSGGSLVTKLYLTLATPWTILPGSSVHGILQATKLEWVSISFSRGSF